eukprot:3992440-Pleurochrysis_carterae.AAC.1
MEISLSSALSCVDRQSLDSSNALLCTGAAALSRLGTSWAICLLIASPATHALKLQQRLPLGGD